MKLQPFAYMAWAKSRCLAGGFSMTMSGMPPPPPELLGLEDLPLTLKEVDPYGPSRVADLLAKRHNVTREEVLLCGGSASLSLFLTGMCLLEPGDLVLAELPGYEAFYRFAQVFQARVEPLPRPQALGRAVDEEALASGLKRGARLVVLSNLHNPTGARLEGQDLARIAETCACAGARLVVDEVFAEFFRPEERPVPAYRAHANAVTLSSFTKAFGVGSLRAGWVLGPPDLVRRMQQAGDLLQVVNPTLPFLVLERLLDRENEVRAWLDGELERIRPALRALQEHPALSFGQPAGGVCCFAAVAGTTDTAALARFLAEEHQVHVVPGAFFGEPERIRVGLALPAPQLASAKAALETGLEAWGAAPRP